MPTLQYFCPLKHQKTLKSWSYSADFFIITALSRPYGQKLKIHRCQKLGWSTSCYIYFVIHTHFTKLLLMYCTWNVHTTNPYITQRIQQWKAHSKLIAVFFAQPTAIFLIATCSFWLVVGTHSTRPKRFAQRWVFKVSIRS